MRAGAAVIDITPPPGLAMSGYGVAVANALDSLKAEADLVTKGRASEGVRELIESLIKDDLSSAAQGRKAMA